jgi:putative transposase
MCRVLAVSASGYYAWCQRPPSIRARADAELTSRITAIHQYARATYGTPRIHEELLAANSRVGHKRVARLMKAAGLCGVSRRKWVATTVRERGARPAPDLVERNFVAAAPDRLWVADAFDGRPFSATARSPLSFAAFSSSPMWRSARIRMSIAIASD